MKIKFVVFFANKDVYRRSRSPSKSSKETFVVFVTIYGSTCMYFDLYVHACLELNVPNQTECARILIYSAEQAKVKVQISMLWCVTSTYKMFLNQQWTLQHISYALLWLRLFLELAPDREPKHDILVLHVFNLTLI